LCSPSAFTLFILFVILLAYSLSLFRSFAAVHDEQRCIYTGVFSVLQVVPAACFEVCALDNVGEGKYDVSTKVRVDVFR